MRDYVNSAALQEYTTKLVAKLKTLFPGTPTAAATVADMTDHSKTYVYVGSETGYTAGDWYYWDGSAWTSGGPFQATSIITDTTLAVAGEAADAKATGDAIAAAKTAVLNAIAPAYNPSATYAVGKYVNHNGKIYRCTTAITTAEAWTAGHWTEVPMGTDLADQVSDLKNALNTLADFHTPTNYGEISASDAVIPTADAENVTIADNASGGIDLTNASGTNVAIGFPLDDLAYTENKAYNIKVKTADAVTPIFFGLYSGKTAESGGTIRYTLTANAEDPTIYEYNNLTMANYNYASYGKLFLVYNLRYNQTTAANIQLDITEVGDVAKTTIRNNVLENIGEDNLSSDILQTLGQVSTNENEITTINTTLDDVIENHVPVNYGEISASDAIVPSAMGGNVTIVDNASGGIDITNASGVNGGIAFPLNDLAYTDNSKKYDVKVKLTGGVTPIFFGLYSGKTAESGGTIRYTLTANAEDPTIYEYNNLTMANYNYASYGKLFLVYNLRYNQTTAANIQLEIVESGDTTKTLVKNTAIEDIGEDNLTDNLKKQIDVVSGSKPTLYGGKEITTFNKGVAIGDSLTAGVFNYNEGGSTGYETYAGFSFPAKLKQLSGVDITNVSNGGYTSAEWWTAHENDDLSGNQFAIIQLGVNDAIELSGWTQTSITAFTNIINKLKTENNGIFIFVSTIIPATSYSGTSYDEVSEGIRDLVESLNDTHVILLDMALYGNTKNALGYNNGHLSALGYDRLAQDYYSYISYVISKNLTLFRNIQFIGTTHSFS